MTLFSLESTVERLGALLGTHLGTFDDFVKIKSNEEQIAKQIQQARQLLSKKASATPLATEVREEDEVEVKVSTPMTGPSKARSRNGQDTHQRSSARSC